MQEYVGLLGTLEEEEEGAAVAMTCMYGSRCCDESRIYYYHFKYLTLAPYGNQYRKMQLQDRHETFSFETKVQ